MDLLVYRTKDEIYELLYNSESDIDVSNLECEVSNSERESDEDGDICM